MASSWRQPPSPRVVLTLACLVACGPSEDPPGGTDSTTTGGPSPSTDAGTAASSFGTSALTESGPPTESSGSRSDCDEDYAGDLVIDGTSSLEEYGRLRSVSGQLVIRDLGGVADLTFLSCLEEVGDWLTVTENPDLLSLDGLGALHSVGMATGYRGLNIADNPSLSSLDGLDSLTYVPRVGIHGNDALTSLGLSALQSSESVSIGGCSQEDRAGPAVGTGNNESLVSFNGLEALERTGFLSISGQQNLSSIDSLIALSESGVDLGGITIQYNPQLAIADIEQLMLSQDAILNDEYVCGNLGGTPECDCYLDGE